MDGHFKYNRYFDEPPTSADDSNTLGVATAAAVMASLSTPSVTLANHQLPVPAPRPRSRSVSNAAPLSPSGSTAAGPPAGAPRGGGGASMMGQREETGGGGSTPSAFLPPIPNFRSFDDAGGKHDPLALNSLPSGDLRPGSAANGGGGGGSASPQATGLERYRGRVTSSGNKLDTAAAARAAAPVMTELQKQFAPAPVPVHGAAAESVFAEKLAAANVDTLVSPLRTVKISSKLSQFDLNAPAHKSGVEYGSLISTIPDQRRNIVAKRGEVFTLMVAGESGLGKTTLVNTLFGDKFEDTSLSQRQPLDGNTPKTTRTEVREAIYIENGFPVKFTVIDTPGFGDYTNNTHCWVPIINYIDNQHKLYMLQEEQPDRRKKVDTRVHVCLYFIRPSGKGLLPLDIKIMQELSTRVNLIPVLAKADSFTLKDREFFKQSVRETIASSGIEIYSPQDLGADMDVDIREMPYAIIASETIVGHDANGRPIRARPYRWGIAEVENEEHCDFVKLRRVLMEKYMLDLIDSTVDKHYQRYRKNCMQRRIEYARGALTDAGMGDVAARILDADGGLQTLVQISRYGKSFLEDGQLENDPIFRERQHKMNDKYAVIVAFHEDRFEAWRHELRKKQDELNQDIENASKELDELQNTIEMLEGQRDYETERVDRESRGGFNKVRYGMRK